MAGMDDAELLRLDGTATLDRFDEIQQAYAEAFPGYSLDDHRWRTSRQANAPGFETVIAHVDGQIIGFAYGLPLAATAGWWDGLSPDPGPDFVRETGDRTFAVIDLAVLPASRGQGLGRRIMGELLRGRHEERATLASNPAKPENQVMYERWGWRVAGRTPGGERTTATAFDIYVIALRAPDSASNSR